MQTLSVRAIVPLALLLAATAACSKSNTSASLAPTAPSATTAAVAPGASISGMVVSGTSAAPALAGGVYSAMSAAGRVTITVNGTSISVTSDDNGNFVLTNVPAGVVTLTISGPGFSSQVTLPSVNVNDQLRITVRLSGSSAELDDQEHESEGKVEIEGQIGSVSGLSSSGGTILVGRLNTAVLVNASTSITMGNTPMKPNDLVVGARVHVRASQSGSTLTATTVIVQQASTPGSSNSGSGNSGKGNGGDDDDDEVEGVITDTPAGGCPASNRFTVGTTKVTTNASTTFDNTTCANLAKGDAVSVEGTKQTDGSILATEVEKKNGGGTGSGSSGSGKTSSTGTISGVSGTCPAVSFTMNGGKVSTNASTKYDDGLSCAALSTVPASTKLEVDGTKQTDGSVLASEIGKK